MANMVIGRVLATEKNPTTIDNFTFIYNLSRSVLERLLSDTLQLY